MASYRNLIVDQGSDYNLTFTVTDLTGEPLDLMSFQVMARMKHSYISETFYDLGVTVSDTEPGQITLSVPAETSNGVRYGRYVYDVILIDEMSRPQRVLEGILTINPAVTRMDEDGD